MPLMRSFGCLLVFNYRQYFLCLSSVSILIFEAISLEYVPITGSGLLNFVPVLFSLVHPPFRWPAHLCVIRSMLGRLCYPLLC